MSCGNKYPHSSYLQKHFAGLSHFLKEKNIFTTVHPVWVIVFSIFSLYFTHSPIERLLIVTFSFYSVLLEMLNTSIERTNDRMGCEYNENTKIAKEISGSVTTLSRIPLIIISLMIFYRNFNSCNKLMACD